MRDSREKRISKIEKPCLPSRVYPQLSGRDVSRALRNTHVYYARENALGEERLASVGGGGGDFA